MKFGICASFQQVATLKNSTFDYLEENVQRFLLPERPQAEFDTLLDEARTSLTVPIEAANSLLPADLFLVATANRKVDTTRLERYMKTALARAEQTGIRVLVFGSGGARACPADHDREDAHQQILDHLGRWSDWAEPHHVRIALEPLRYEETNTFNTVAESGSEFVHSVTSGATLLVDTYHMACNREDPETILPYGPVLSHVHVAELQGRSAPGRYGEDFRPYFSVLHRIGYKQRISIECHWQDLATEVDPALAVLRAQWDDVRI